MGKRIRERWLAETQADEKWRKSLLSHYSARKIACPRIPRLDLLLERREVYKWALCYVRPPETWTCRIRTHDQDRIFIDLVRHLFRKYPVPGFLERVWGSISWEGFEDFTGWYVAVATGASLYKVFANPFLSRKETHIFLRAPEDFTVVQNIWWARSIALGASLGTAASIAKSKLRDHPLRDEFWISIMRFFVQYPTDCREMNDLIDYLEASHARTPGFTMKGRTLDSVRRQSRAWHREQARLAYSPSLKWKGFDLPDFTLKAGSADKRNLTIWRVTQIKSAAALVHEGNAQHHCVAWHREHCARGELAIWSMTFENISTGMEPKRAVTIAMNKNYEIIEVKGFANRSARPYEENVIARWVQGMRAEASMPERSGAKESVE